ncbi:hypothetical protein [Streptomyces mirabilis]|uniref:hypothetical protein n=1 Tax=Streptomyces mirabilis TaxID=68239 RepID=UPI0033A34EA3
MLEYLWRAAWRLHDTGDASAEAWVARHARTLLAGGVQQTAAALKAAARVARLRGTTRKGIDDAVNYLTSKAEHLRYDTASGTRLADRHRHHRESMVRHEARCCIPGSAGRNSRGGSWVR